jgi:hypothetical protein
MNPVQSGIADWSYSFQGNNFSDGSEFCVDSKSNVYYVSQPMQIGGLYKFSQSGEVIWKRDSLIQWNYCGISLSADESRIYFVAFKGGSNDKLFCIDSSGKDIWSIPSSNETKPVIGKNGTLYTFVSQYLTAVSVNGNILWQNTSVLGTSQKFLFAIDREDNLYVANRSVALMKIDKNGNTIWQYNTGFYVYGIVIDGYGNVYFNGFNDSLFCLKSNGILKWTKPRSSHYNSPVLTSDNKILIVSDEKIIAIDTGGTKIWESEQILNSIENLILDDNDNVYFLMDADYNIKVGSISNTGVKRWEYISELKGTLPAPVLLPSGKLLFAPKRASKIQALK